MTRFASGGWTTGTGLLKRIGYLITTLNLNEVNWIALNACYVKAANADVLKVGIYLFPVCEVLLCFIFCWFVIWKVILSSALLICLLKCDCVFYFVKFVLWNVNTFFVWFIFLKCCRFFCFVLWDAELKCQLVFAFLKFLKYSVCGLFKQFKWQGKLKIDNMMSDQIFPVLSDSRKSCQECLGEPYQNERAKAVQKNTK